MQNISCIEIKQLLTAMFTYCQFTRSKLSVLNGLHQYCIALLDIVEVHHVTIKDRVFKSEISLISRNSILLTSFLAIKRENVKD